MSGPGWQGLADDTKAQKARQGFPDKVMVATGVLRDSLTQITGPQRVYERSPDVLRFGTTVPYAHFHQSGTRFMAQRKLIDLSVKERDEMAGIIMRYITRGQSEGAEL
jgi:phage gpG-like protein